MASALKSALPAHLKGGSGKPSGLGSNGDPAAEFARKHHGKTQSHMVSEAFLRVKLGNHSRALGSLLADKLEF